jgi:hypothetical protein
VAPRAATAATAAIRMRTGNSLRCLAWRLPRGYDRWYRSGLPILAR